VRVDREEVDACVGEQRRIPRENKIHAERPERGSFSEANVKADARDEPLLQQKKGLVKIK
jgi:hypothetical protein